MAKYFEEADVRAFYDKVATDIEEMTFISESMIEVPGRSDRAERQRMILEAAIRTSEAFGALLESAKNK